MESLYAADIVIFKYTGQFIDRCPLCVMVSFLFLKIATASGFFLAHFQRLLLILKYSMCLAWAGAARLEGRSRQPSQALRDAIDHAQRRLARIGLVFEVRLFSPRQLFGLLSARDRPTVPPTVNEAYFISVRHRPR